MWLLLLVLLLPVVLSESVGGPEVCYPQVFIHQKDRLPSTSPFCILRANSKEKTDEIGEATIIENLEQWRLFAIENGIPLDDGNETQTEEEIVVRVSESGEESPLSLPAAFLSPFCTATQSIQLGEDSLTSCVPRFTSFDENECRSSFWNARALLRSLLTTPSSFGNLSLAVPINSSSLPVVAPGWRNGLCLNLMQQVRLVVALNESTIESAWAEDLRYINLASNNHSTVSHSIGIRFVTAGDVVVDVGLRAGDDILTQWRRPFQLPDGPFCSRLVPVRFNETVTTMCSIQFSSCDEARASTSRMLSLLPAALLHSSTPQAQQLPILVADDTRVAGTGGCELAAGISLTLAHSLSGPISSPTRLLVSAVAVEERLALPPVTTNASFLFSFALQFVDVTPKPTRIFASPPRIDLRLPADFFYPFLFNSRHLTSPPLHFLFPSLLIFRSLLSSSFL